MRLLHTYQYVFKEFMGADVPEYAIVSHRWSDEEVSYQDFLQGRREGYGWTKIAKACDIALSRKHDWLWIDTCKSHQRRITFNLAGSLH